MADEIVLHPETGQLSRKVVVESYEPVEIGQLQAVVADKQVNVDGLYAQRDALNNQISDAEGALADSKSGLEVAQGLVATDTVADPQEELDESVADEQSESETTEEF